MSESERITIEELRKQLFDLESWKVKYQEASELWDALELKDNQHISGAVLVAKVKDFDSGTVAVALANTENMDWVDQVGILRAGSLICEREDIEKDND